ncbi:3-isopropylmalate dehydratase small subunit [Carboxydothermus islandicus]|uniref:3-isopropylmalate dehydratase small subunit n=1 Tax=Carboxydothermus islandicus TaxID=661089 RepID=A0A1L8D011_9THEO|nr:3-isopropylmalate dehydratase small subunit [Carboxydothermus islandicus]GAV24469.1 3-isopropylmalate dehydratase small subunit [Carboxydothermus islandicus]
MRAFKFGDDIDTDVIIPARYLNTSDPEELAKHCMEDADPEFAKKARPGDVIVAGKNFGCGSSREHAPIAIKALGIEAVIAKSFARIFYRNSFNIGLKILECPEAAEKIRDGDELSINYDTGEIKNLTTGESYFAKPIPEFMQNIIAKGGLINYVREKLQGTV